MKPIGFFFIIIDQNYRLVYIFVFVVCLHNFCIEKSEFEFIYFIIKLIVHKGIFYIFK